ncbi:hypothetical protein BRADI_3g44385v3 [Brachypodium distachyon]|uniref:Uncharacterized protein n=1 Tax=Brachypodium distachyon TaxID=15368 RepID=A0A2K2D348_BRADI|nr:hypothetical protein BRADI_3g44385v3 [Brachypodium distachyon]PNT68702.1 hypothetical protein BRADI_3g44385v3 [Brachypodium distachyon]PNT68703.1 hypothetical protein BRADI_3g44385v3 [Brachypodium distachyon]PNT68704.1 hypothetical protein BRADI_3g44385v3 [Brachypodium distachyon]
MHAQASLIDQRIGLRQLKQCVDVLALVHGDEQLVHLLAGRPPVKCRRSMATRNDEDISFSMSMASAGLPRREEAEGVHVLVVLLRALDMVGDRVPQELLELREVGRHGDLGALEAVVQARVAPAGGVGRQAVAVAVVHHLRELREHELIADRRDAEPRVVHGHADGACALEVAAVDRLAAGNVVDRALDGLCGGADPMTSICRPSQSRTAVMMPRCRREGRDRRTP